MYHLYHPEVTGRSKRSAHDYVNRLKDDPRVGKKQIYHLINKVISKPKQMLWVLIEAYLRFGMFGLILYIPVNNFSVMSRQIFMG